MTEEKRRGEKWEWAVACGREGRVERGEKGKWKKKKKKKN